MSAKKNTDIVVVDGSNIATEGRTEPSLAQLQEAVRLFKRENPKAKLIVVVDASFEHRIPESERTKYQGMLAAGSLITPPAGTVGRGDAFILAVAAKASCRVLSNDSFQEFHDTHTWLFDDNRLVGGKPVPNVGWVFVERTPVRQREHRRPENTTRPQRQPRRRTGRVAEDVRPAKTRTVGRTRGKKGEKRD